MMNKIRKTTLVAFTTLVLAALSVSTAFAAPPLALHIEVDEVIATSGETFFASGASVLAGEVCPTGTVEDLSTTASGAPGGPITILQVVKRFTCADLSGTFDVRLVVRLDNLTHYTTANWRVVSGTGAYAGLHGNGSLAGTPIDPGLSIRDVYDGKVH